MLTRDLTVDFDAAGKRLDIFLAEALAAHFSRTQIKKIIEAGGVSISGRRPAAHARVQTGDQIRVEWQGVSEDGIRAEDIPLSIVYEDDTVILVNKPAGMVVHPAYGSPHHTLVNALLHHFKSLSQVGGALRPGIVHRLDKDTSGIMVVAKNDRAHSRLARQFKQQTVERVYRVIVRGTVQHDEGLCDEPVGRAFLNRKKVVVKPSGGKDAQTYYRVMKRFKTATLLEVLPKTGRTHQIRVHMGYLGHPVLGDSLYGVTIPEISRQAVHAFSLGFAHPQTGQGMRGEAPLPEDMMRLIEHLDS